MQKVAAKEDQSPSWDEEGDIGVLLLYFLPFLLGRSDPCWLIAASSARFTMGVLAAFY